MHEDKEENKVSLFIYRNINVSINITSYYEVIFIMSCYVGFCDFSLSSNFNFIQTYLTIC